MLKKLRRRLTLLYCTMTGLLLAAILILALSISEAQMNRASEAAFRSNINTIVFKLQSDFSISGSWLSQTEAGDRLVIAIQDNRTDLLFAGAWSPVTDRAWLIDEARRQALADGVDYTLPPSSYLDADSTVFRLYGKQGERYLGAVALVPVQHGWHSLTLLRDMRLEDAAISQQRFLFGGLVAASILLLFLVSWVFAGRAIRPIEESARKQVEFVAAASHELRSPLAVLRASAGALLAEPTQAERFCGTIERECVRMSRLVDDLLLLAGSDAKSWSIRPGPVELDTLLIEVVDAFLPLAHERKQQLLLSLPDEALPVISGDAQRLQQALSVLIDNACAYTPAGGAIAVRVNVQGKELCVEVEDDGPGIPPEHAQHVFERFYRVDRARNDKSHFGLGLCIAHELIALHHGKLALQAAAGGGCIFIIRLPLPAHPL